jgi:putative DNA primase/helicase
MGKKKKARGKGVPLACTDTGNARRLIKYFEGQFYYVRPWKCFIVWTGTHWEKDDGDILVARLVDKMIALIKEEELPSVANKYKAKLARWRSTSQSATRVAAAIKRVKSQIEVEIDHRKIDAHPFLLNFMNGTVDVTTGELRPHQPSDLITKIIPIDFDATAKAPQWRQFLKRVLPRKSVRNFIQRFAGYCATGDVSERVLVMLHGKGRNGKSVFLRVLQDALGPYAVTAPPGLLMAQKHEAHPAEIADLFGARLAVTSEVRKGRTFDEEKVKRLTGNDKLKARLMRENFWEFFATFKLLMAINHLPRVKDTSDSIWDRFVLIAFKVRIPKAEVDSQLLTKLAEELPGILAWIVRGAVAWKTDGLARPKSIEIATKKYRSSEDIAGQFLQQRCSFKDPTAWTSTDELMTKMELWCEANHYYKIGAKELKERLEDRGCVSKRTNAKRGWAGVKLVRKGPKEAATKDNSSDSPLMQ